MRRSRPAPRRRRGSWHRQAGEGLADPGLQDAVRRRHDGAGAGVPQVALEREAARVALAAADLERALRHLLGGLGRDDLRLHQRDERRRVAGVAERRRVAHDEPRGARRHVERASACCTDWISASDWPSG